jgi:hypothetical protein
VKNPLCYVGLHVAEWVGEPYTLMLGPTFIMLRERRCRRCHKVLPRKRYALSS